MRLPTYSSFLNQGACLNVDRTVSGMSIMIFSSLFFVDCWSHCGTSYTSFEFCFGLDCLCLLALWASRKPALPVVLIHRQRYVDSDFLFSFLCSLFTTQCGMSHTAFQLCFDLDWLCNSGRPYLGSRFFWKGGLFESRFSSCGMSTTFFRFNAPLLLMLWNKIGGIRFSVSLFPPRGRHVNVCRMCCVWILGGLAQRVSSITRFALLVRACCVAAGFVGRTSPPHT